MKISEIFKDYKGKDVEINGIKTNSKEVKENDMFVCIQGANIDRHEYIDEAIKNGASFVVGSKDIKTNIPYIKLDNPNKELINILSKFYDYPQNKLILIGITGTDGKTTSAKIIQQLIGENICGYIGTIGADCAYFNELTSNTTPSLEVIFKYLDKFVKNNIKYVVIEVSSEAYFYNRIDGLTFDLALLTNITSEHLNTHKTIENYVACKKELFKNSKKQVLNIDDKHFKEIKEVSNDYLTYGYNNEANLIINDYKLYPNKSIIEYTYDTNTYKYETSLLGKFNIDNLALAIATLKALHIELNDIETKLKELAICGRMEKIELGQDFYCIIDYAHTTNAIKNVLEFVNTLDVNRIITITGQAGGREKEKRKDIGKIVLDLSSYAILTEDDPREEKVIDIINMMLKETNKTNYEIVLDRKEAIKKAIEIAKPKDLLLFLGKGSDKYMAYKESRAYYDEKEEVTKAIKNASNVVSP